MNEREKNVCSSCGIHKIITGCSKLWNSQNNWGVNLKVDQSLKQKQAYFQINWTHEDDK